MKRAAPILAAIAVTTVSLGASARERCHRLDTDIFECSPEPEPDEVEAGPPLNDSGSIDVRFAFVSFSPLVADKRFTGSGTPVGGTGTTSFSATGKDLGFVR